MPTDLLGEVRRDDTLKDTLGDSAMLVQPGLLTAASFSRPETKETTGATVSVSTTARSTATRRIRTGPSGNVVSRS